VAWSLFAYFGLVGALSHLFFTVGRLGRNGTRTALSVARAGVLGSFWWWLEFKPWCLPLSRERYGVYSLAGVCRGLAQWGERQRDLTETVGSLPSRPRTEEQT
jgi:hypothetical protein